MDILPLQQLQQVQQQQPLETKTQAAGKTREWGKTAARRSAALLLVGHENAVCKAASRPAAAAATCAASAQQPEHTSTHMARTPPEQNARASAKATARGEKVALISRPGRPAGPVDGLEGRRS
jgi:hypothetical protein